MRLTVIHDSRGEILALAAFPPDSPPVQMEVGPGQRMTVVDAPEGTVDLESDQLNESLANFMKNYRVDVESAGGVLTSKDDATDATDATY